MTKLEQTLGAIDAANAADPNKDDGSPASQLYGQRMSSELERLFPDAGDVLKIAARGQHIERWILARSTYPEGKAGYHAWRRDLAKHHADRVGALMSEAGYSEEETGSAGRMLRKEGIKRHADVQALEDVICFVFLKWYFAPFAAKHSEEKIQSIVGKTARKMSDQARMRVLAEFDLPAELASAFKP
jgi:CRP-like cAMP-binding protein